MSQLLNADGIFDETIGLVTCELFDLLVATKERIGPYGVVGSAPWPARRGMEGAGLVTPT